MNGKQGLVYFTKAQDQLCDYSKIKFGYEQQFKFYNLLCQEMKLHDFSLTLHVKYYNIVASKDLWNGSVVSVTQQSCFWFLFLGFVFLPFLQKNCFDVQPYYIQCWFAFLSSAGWLHVSVTS